MTVILLLIPLSIVTAAGFLAGFIWAVRSGQYEDTCTPALRVLMEEPDAAKPGPLRASESGSAPDGCDANI